MVALLALIACSPEPASIKFDGEAVSTVHTLDAVAVHKASVLDADGKALEPQPALTWTVTPPAVATVDAKAGKVTPVANGEATVEAAVGAVKGQYKFVVALPDKIEIAGYTAGTPWPAGQSAKLEGKVMAGDKVVEGQTVTWSSSSDTVATVAADGTVNGVADGTATITATSGALTATQDVTIGGAVAAAPADGAAAPQ